MKTIMAILFSVLLPASAFAWWLPQGQIIVNNNVVQSAVYNQTPAMAFCQGYVYGQTQYGQVLTNAFSSYIPPFTSAYVNVYAYAPYFFVSGWADIRCQ